jgi:glycosyltransferase EpsE
LADGFERRNGNGFVNSETPFFSIILPVFNGEKFLSKAIESILRQTEKDWELIVVDDCSTDATPEILKNYGEKFPAIRTFRNETNRDIAYSLNRGIENARGKWIARLDADDFFSKEYLNILHSVIEATGERTDYFFSSWVTVVDEHSQKVLSFKLPEAEFIEKMMPHENFLYHPATSFSKEAWEKVGGYPMKTPLQAEDAGMWLQFFNSGMRLWMIQEPLVYYRIHNSNATSEKDACLEGNLSSRQRALQRQGKEWRISLFLKQKRLKQARKELLHLFQIQKTVTLKNINYFIMTFLPSSLVYFFMWKVRPLFRSWVRRKAVFTSH